MTTPDTEITQTSGTTDTAAANTVTLDTPIKRGALTIDKVTLRKPTAGELRGVSLAELLQMKVDALQAVLPRITQPMLHKQEMHALDPADLVNLGTVVVGFLLTSRPRRRRYGRPGAGVWLDAGRHGRLLHPRADAVARARPQAPRTPRLTLCNNEPCS
jgi:hypothetical protein